MNSHRLPIIVVLVAALATTCALPQLDARAAATTTKTITTTKTAKTVKTVTKVVVKMPSDAQVVARAKRTGAQLTRGGPVAPNTKLKGTVKKAKPAPVKLTAAEKKTEVGTARKSVTTRGGGVAYIFIKPQNVANLGHIGWGYWAPNMKYFVAGSTENPATSRPQSSVYIAPRYNNGYWASAFNTESQMFANFKSKGYYAFKRISVSTANPDLAWSRACYTRDSGFIGLGWNCLDHTYYVLEGYGVTGMPWKQTNPAPNGWFNAFPGTGYRLP